MASRFNSTLVLLKGYYYRERRNDYCFNSTLVLLKAGANALTTVNAFNSFNSTLVLLKGSCRN